MAFYEDSANLLTGNVANQTFTGQSAGDLENWLPTSGGVTNSRVIAYLYPEGSYASADAGRLDLGVIRDSALSDTNDFEVFAESFEGIVPKVIDSLKLTMTFVRVRCREFRRAASGYCTAS